MKPKICILDHTADAGVEIYGKTLPELFQNAASAMYQILGCEKELPCEFSKIFEIKEEELEILIVTFLNELNYYITVKNTLLNPIQNLRISQHKEGFTLSFQASLIQLEPEISKVMPEIKSVTYHKMDIQKKNKNYYTCIFFDL